MVGSGGVAEAYGYGLLEIKMACAVDKFDAGFAFEIVQHIAKWLVSGIATDICTSGSSCPWASTDVSNILPNTISHRHVVLNFIFWF